MKIRINFVSNSSSASFSIPLNVLHEWQLTAILTNDYGDDPWDEIWVDETQQVICGDTSMDNFDMFSFLTEKLGIPEDYITFHGGG